MAGKLADYGYMDLSNAIEDNAGSAPMPLSGRRSHRILWAIGLLAVIALVAIAFGAYRQPDLLLNLVGLRYCG